MHRKEAPFLSVLKGKFKRQLTPYQKIPESVVDMSATGGDCHDSTRPRVQGTKRSNNGKNQMFTPILILKFSSSLENISVYVHIT